MSTLANPVSSCPAYGKGDAGWVHSWDISTGVDGPGTRLVVFLAGCPMRCLYCQNPDTWRKRDGKLTTLAHMRRKMARYRPFIDASGGGFTLSGGEPLMQPAFATQLFEAAREQGLHTALDTSGFLGIRADEQLMDAVDLVLLDIKAGTESCHRELTGRPILPTLQFARRLAEGGRRVWVRYVLVPGYNDAPAELDAFISLVSELAVAERVEILPFHTLGASKYERLGIRFPLADTPPAAPKDVAAARARMLAGGLPVA